MDHHEASTQHYVKIWGILLVLLVISVCGPMLEIQVVTLITAFGIAIVKAVIVAAYFMHLKFEKKYITYMLLTMLAFMFVFVAGILVDTMKPAGHRWEKIAPDPAPASQGH